MEDIFSKFNKITRSGRKAALCIIVDTQGSTPRKTGAKMIVVEHGTIEGTIGGGSLELQVIKDALTVIGKNEPRLFKHALEKDLGMACGGYNMIYIEPINPEKKLFIFGGGHIGKALAKYTPDFGFTVSIIDNRENIFIEQLDPNIKLIKSDYLEAINELEFDESTFVVIVTPKHATDEAILEKCGKIELGYLGMIGSKSKITKVRKRFLSEKILSEKELERVDMPVGVKFNAQTPEEIALSILAKMIDVKNNNRL